MSVYTWGEAKRTSNLEKHGLDFAAAYLAYENPEKITLNMVRDGETRRQDIALVRHYGRVVSLAYVERGGTVRCISFRPASWEERKVYEAAYPGQQGP